MAKLLLRSGKRGRPLMLDTEDVLNQIYKFLPRAKKVLAEFRRTSSGISDAELLGTRTSLPEWLDATITGLERLHPSDITYERAREFKADLRIVKRLASRRKSISSTALENIITTQYERDIEEAIEYSSDFAKEQYEQLLTDIRALTPNERIVYYTSKRYQDIGSFRNKRYKRIRAWASDSVGRELTYKESYAYLFRQRQQAGLNIDFMEY